MAYDSIGDRDNTALIRFETQPYGSHHNRKTKVHQDTDTVGDDIAIAFDERAMK
jgi:hypothetical protein